MAETYDYIVIGAGSAGCIVAGELAAGGPARVLVLERGAAAEAHPETLAAAGYKKAFINDALMYDRYSAPQPECAGHSIYLGSGRGVGGSGAVNAMVYTRGARHDYAEWGLDGWRWDDLQPTFTALEARLNPHRRPPTRYTEACIAAAEAAGFRRKEDLNDGALSGYLGYEWMSYDGDDRRSSYVAFLRPARARPNLSLVTDATVARVLVEPSGAGPRAVGVEYRLEGRTVVARATREVILTAGALETPKLLLLSGIGPADELRRHGIPVVLDQPAVGQNLMDHPNVSLFFVGKRPTDCEWPQLYGFHRANPASALPAGEADTCYVFYSARSSFREGAIRLLPGMALPPSLYRFAPLRDGLRAALKGVFALPPVRRFVQHMHGIVVILGKPESRGELRLRSRDPEEPAWIDPRYFAARADLDTVVDGVERARAIADTDAMRKWGAFELSPGRRARTRAQLERFVRKNVMTTYHFSGTCKMGNGGDAVVDDELRLRGVAGLRVADASAIPVAPVSAMNATSMLIGLRAAGFLAAATGEGQKRPSAFMSDARADDTL